MRSALAVKGQRAKARLAAATAASLSAWSPSEMTAQGSSFEGSITSKSFALAGATHCPSM